MSDLRMDAYYYSFQPTGVDEIDRILSAVATAGKRYHHTSDWDDHGNVELDEMTPVEFIQLAAEQAALHIESLRRTIEFEQGKPDALEETLSVNLIEEDR